MAKFLLYNVILHLIVPISKLLILIISLQDCFCSVTQCCEIKRDSNYRHPIAILKALLSVSVPVVLGCEYVK